MKRYQVMLAKAAKPFDSPDWIFEIKWDGTRALLYINDGVHFINRRGIDITYRYPEFDTIRQAIAAKEAVIDGEIVVLRKGRADFQALQEREHQTDRLKIAILSRTLPATYVAFDLLRLNGRELLDEPLIERKRLLRQIIVGNDRIVFSEHVRQYGKRFYEMARKRALEGVMAKKIDSPYLPGKRSALWLKIKQTQTIDAVILGYTKGEGKRADTFGALILGAYVNGRLRYIGRVGTGFDQQLLKKLIARMRPLVTPKPPIPPPPLPREAVWLKPHLVAEVKCMQLTRDLKLRAPVFVRLRDDKPARECTL